MSTISGVESSLVIPGVSETSSESRPGSVSQSLYHFTTLLQPHLKLGRVISVSVLDPVGAPPSQPQAVRIILRTLQSLVCSLPRSF